MTSTLQTPSNLRSEPRKSYHSSRLLVGRLLWVLVTPTHAAARRPWLGATTHLSSLSRFRGGSSTDSYPTEGYFPPQQQQPPQQQHPQSSLYEPPPPDVQNADDPFHETVQQRVDTWKTHQREYAERLQSSPRDEKGRMKLLTSVSKGSRALIFFFLLWRNVHLYEVADQTTKGLRRLFLVTPMIVLFLGNLMGVVASLSTPGHAAKRRLKAILNLDKLVEAILIVYAFGRLTIAPSKYVPREIFITNILHSFLFLLQCQAFTRLSWDEQAAQPMHTFTQQQRPSYVEENNLAQPLGEEDDEERTVPYDNPYQRPY